MTTLIITQSQYRSIANLTGNMRTIHANVSMFLVENGECLSMSMIGDWYHPTPEYELEFSSKESMTRFMMKYL